MSNKAAKRTQSQAFTEKKEHHPRVSECSNKKSRTKKADPIETKSKKKAKVVVDGRKPLKKRTPRKKKVDIISWPLQTLLPQDDIVLSFGFPEGSFVFELGNLPDYAKEGDL